MKLRGPLMVLDLTYDKHSLITASNMGASTCSMKLWEPLMVLDLTYDKHLLITASNMGTSTC